MSLSRVGDELDGEGVAEAIARGRGPVQAGVSWAAGGSPATVASRAGREPVTSGMGSDRAVTDHDDHAVQWQGDERVEEVQEHRPAAQRVQDLGRARPHAGALTRGEDDGSQWPILVH